MDMIHHTPANVWQEEGTFPSALVQVERGNKNIVPGVNPFRPIGSPREKDGESDWFPWWDDVWAYPVSTAGQLAWALRNLLC